MQTFVFSRTLKEIDGPGVRLVASDAVEFVRRFKQEPGKDICLMGGSAELFVTHSIRTFSQAPNREEGQISFL
jgi:dihydrofolate reductase